MGDFAEDVGERNQGAIALVLDVAKAFDAGQSSSCVGLGDTFQFSLEDFASSTSGVYSFKDVGAAPDHHGPSPRVKVELLAPAHCDAGCSE